jgi:hypothetical protein
MEITAGQAFQEIGENSSEIVPLGPPFVICLHVGRLFTGFLQQFIISIL